MIGDDSSRSDRSGGPASTGQVCSRTCNRRRTAEAHRGGSVTRDPRPGSAASTVCAAISDVRSTSSRGAPGGHTPSLMTSRRSRSARGRGRAGRRSTRPPVPAHGATTAQHSRRRGPRSHDPDAGSSTGIGLLGRSASATSASTCRGTPSSNGKYWGSSTDSFHGPTQPYGVRAPAAAGIAAGSAASQPGLGSSSASVRLRVGSVPSDARGEHAELPAQPVLLRRRPVGVQEVPLEQHGVGHRADLIQGTHR